MEQIFDYKHRCLSLLGFVQLQLEIPHLSINQRRALGSKRFIFRKTVQGLNPGVISKLGWVWLSGCIPLKRCVYVHIKSDSSRTMTKSYLRKYEHLSDMWLSTLEIGAGLLHFVTEVGPESPFMCVNWSPTRYGVRVGAKAIQYSQEGRHRRHCDI